MSVLKLSVLTSAESLSQAGLCDQGDQGTEAITDGDLGNGLAKGNLAKEIT